MEIYSEVRIELNPPYNGTYGATRLINQTIDVLFSSRELRPVVCRHDELPCEIRLRSTKCANLGFKRCYKYPL